MSPETKKRLAYGGLILVAGAVGIYLWKKYETATGAVPSGTAASDAQTQADALNQEEQLAAIASLGSQGSQLTSPNIGETPVEPFGQEVSAILQAAGLEPPTVVNPGSGGTPASPVTAAPATTTVPATPTTPINRGPILRQGPITELAGEREYQY